MKSNNITEKNKHNKTINNIFKTDQMSEHIITGLILAVVGGFLDAYTYICRGHVFANAQTGNIVLLGVHLSEGEIKEAFSYLIPIIAFAMGIVIANVIKLVFKTSDETTEKTSVSNDSIIHWRQIILLFEIILIAVVANLPVGYMDGLANVIVSFVCSLQVESFRKINGYAYASTMCTGNLRSGTEHLFGYFRTKDVNKLVGSIHYFSVILFFIIGALLGAIFTGILAATAAYIAVIGLILAMLIMFIK